MLATLTNISLDAAEDNTWKYANILWYTNVLCVDEIEIATNFESPRL